MKRILPAILIVISFAACKKTAVNPGLFGRWELTRMYGGLSYRDSVYTKGNGNIYQFNRDSTYKKYDSGALTSQGRFHIRTDNGYHPQTTYVILFDSDTYGEPMSITGTTLTLGTSVADGFASDYQKTSN